MKDYEYLCTVDRVIDGDTVDVIVDLGFDIHHRIRIRLEGVDTPERGHDDWSRATAMLRDLMPRKIDQRPQVYMLRTYKTGKYGRWLGQLTRITDGVSESVNINEWMAREWPADV